MNKLQQWFFTTKLGELYFDLLLWIDRKKDKPKFLTSKEISQITREYSLIDRGVKKVKTKVNTLINSNTAEEYDKVLKEIEDLCKLSKYDKGDPEFKLAQIMYSIQAKKNKDIITHTDKAKMIQDRINDYKQLQNHKEKREIMRNIRKARKEGNLKLAEKLEQEWKVKYGRK